MTKGYTLLHLIDTGGPGGAETVYLRLAAGLQAAGWGSVTVVNRDDWLAARLRESRIPPIILDSKGSLNLGYLRQLCRIVRAHDAKAIVTHLYGSAVYGGLAGRITGVPTVSILHGQSDVDPRARLSRLKARLVASNSRRLVAVSAPLRDALSAMIPASPESWTVIPNGVDTEALKPGRSMGLRQQLGIPRDACLVGALGNIRKPKAYDVFLQVASRLASGDQDIHFVIAGQGSGVLMEELVELRRSLGLENHVHFLGSLSDIAGYLGDLDIFLLTSKTEGFSIACVEAMACGLPVVATRSGGPEQIVAHGITGFLCPVDGSTELADRILALCDNPELRSRLGASGRARAGEQFSLKGMIDAYDELIRAALEN